MAKLKTASTVELGNVAPTLRSDLKFSLQHHGGTPCYLIEDEKNSKYFRVGLPEYTFISLLDGTTSIREAMAYTAARLGKDAFSEQDAAAICKWMIDSQLAFTGASQDHERLYESARGASRARVMQSLNPLMIRLPVARPDRMITALTRALGGWFSAMGFILWLSLIGLAVYEVLSNWTAVSAGENLIFAQGNWLRLLVAWCLLKFVHEASHGIACKRFGGHVRESGLLFIVFAPVPYVDVTSAWRFPSKWHRIVVSAAGMYTELAIAAVAAIVWARSEPGVLHQQAYNVLLAASAITLVFNANPLMRFDGYYILSDLMEIPNLYALGQQYLKQVWRRWFLGLTSRTPNWTRRRGIVIRLYGILSLLWRILVCAGLLVAASTVLAGAGIILAIAAGCVWLAVPVIRFVPYLVWGDGTEKPRIRQFAIACAIVLAAGIGIGLLPEPGGVRAPAVVNYHPLHTVRAPFSGFVKQINVNSGSPVQLGDTLLVMENAELVAETEDMRLERNQTQHRGRIYRKEGDLPAMQVELELGEVLKKKIIERSTQLEKAVLVAPAAGRVVTRDVASLVGQYVREGEELMAIGTENQKHLVIAIAQADIEKFVDQAGKSIDVRLRSPTQDPFSCTLSGIEPRASLELPHLALAATNGGPLAVKSAAADESEDQVELNAPHFTAKLALSDGKGESLMAGQMAIIRLHTSRGTLAGYFYRGITAWFDRRTQRN